MICKKVKRNQLLVLGILFFQMFVMTTINFGYMEIMGDRPTNSDDNSNSVDDFNENNSPFISSFIPAVFTDYSNWQNSFTNIDQNSNQINDRLDDLIITIQNEESNTELDQISSSEIKDVILGRNNIKKAQTYENDEIPIIIQFPEGDINSIISLFKNLQGTIKNTFNAAINGFAGRISIENLELFTDTLNIHNLPYLIEEDALIESNLYYSSRNMNLRPYTWNNLSYTGDKYSSVAVIDSGIDDSHSFFSPGYSDGGFDYKIVGWRDETSSQTQPYDDNGHGSHCAGIIAGNGTSVLDTENRTVGTFNYGFDWTGYVVSDQYITITAARFNVTEPGEIKIDCEFVESTPGTDDIDADVYLYHNNGSLLDSYSSENAIWSHNLTYNVTASDLGEYIFKTRLHFDDNDGGGCEHPEMGIRGVIHFPFNVSLYDCGYEWKGVAPDTHLVGIKVLDNEGEGYTSDIIDGVNWAVANKDNYNITVISMSLGGAAGQSSFINAVNNAVNNGIVTVVSAGNDGAGSDKIGSPGDADNVITVAAMNNADNITEYSSQGGASYSGATNKPDITAPGGSDYDYFMFSADSDDNDASNQYPTDAYSDDLSPALGTSMAAPAVAGAANLLIEAMGGHQNWNYTAEEAFRAKSILLMTATETYPLTREIDTSYSPSLNRGGKDVHEGYGRINIDAAIEAVTQDLAINNNVSAYLESSLNNSFSKHALGSYINLNASERYQFSLDVPQNADFDLYLYNNSGLNYGEPELLSSNISAIMGENETFFFTPSKTGKYYLIVKAISGVGLARIRYIPKK